jgi:hypothetical protein
MYKQLLEAKLWRWISFIPGLQWKATHSLFAEPVAAGFPSPAAGYEANELNLHDYCVRHPAATYFCVCPAIPCVMRAFMMAMCWSSIGQKGHCCK